MTLLEYAACGTLEPEARRTIECLLGRVAWRLDQADQKAISEIEARRQSEEQTKKFDLNLLRKLFPWLGIGSRSVGRDAELDLELLGRAFPWISQLTFLNLSHSSPKLRSLEPIGHLPNVKSLYVSNNEIQDLSPLRSLKCLEVLDASGNPLRSLDPLVDVPSLRELVIDNPSIKDLSPLDRLKTLEELTINVSMVEAFAKCKALSELKYLHVNSIFGSIESLERFPPMPRLLEISGLHVDSLKGLEQFPTLLNLTNISGEFDDLTPVASLPQLTHFNALSCECDSLEPISGLSLLRDIGISSDRISQIDIMLELPKACKIHVGSQSLSESEQKKLASAVRSWDAEFLAHQSNAQPNPRIEIVSKAEFNRYDGQEPYGVEGWDGNRRMISSEADWLEDRLETRLNDFLEEQEDYYLPGKVRHARSTTVVLYSEKAVRELSRVVGEIQQILGTAQNSWIVYLHSDMFESGSDWPDFMVWVYPDHVQAQQKDADLIQRHLES